MRTIVWSICILLTLLIAACDDFGEKITVGKGELYYTPNITKPQAERVAKFLADVKLLDSLKKRSYQIDKLENRYILKSAVSKEYAEDVFFVDGFKTIAGFMSKDVFDNAPVDVWLTDKGFEPIKKLEFTALPDSIIEKSKREENQLFTPIGDPNQELPKDNVVPVDTSKGTPA